MSPEQCRGAGLVDEKTDCYALGVMLFELVAGRLPFESRWAGDLLGMHLHVEPPSVLAYCAWLDVRLSGLIHALLRKDKDARPTMQEASDLLGQLIKTWDGRENAGQLIQTSERAELAPTDPGGEASQPLTLGHAIRRADAPASTTPLQEAPSQAGLDALLLRTTQARILLGGVYQGEPIGKQVLHVVEKAALPDLHRALRMDPARDAKHCSCLGDFAIELHDDTGRFALLSYHAHDVTLLSMTGWDRDAPLIHRDALLMLLKQEGITKPIAAIQEERRTRAEAHGMHPNAPPKPPSLKPFLRRAELRPQESQVEHVWYLLHATQDPEFWRGARCLVEPETLGMPSRILASIPDSVWARVLNWPVSDLRRPDRSLLLHAHRAAMAQRQPLQKPARMAPLTVVHQAPCVLGTLVTDGIRLYCVEGENLLGIEPFQGEKRVISQLPAADTALACCGPSMVFASRSLGWIGRIHTEEGQIEPLLTHQTQPTQPCLVNWVPHWMEAVPGDDASAFLMQLGSAIPKREPLRKRRDNEIPRAAPHRLAHVNGQPHTVLGFHEHLAYLEGLPDSCAQLRWMATDGIEFETVAPTILVVPEGHGPLLSQDHTHLYWPTGNRVLMTKKLSPDASVCTTAQGPVCGLAATEHGMFVITGKQDDTQWHVEFADRGQAETRRLASFDRPLRAPLCLVSFAGDLFFTCDEKLYRCDSGART